MFTPADRESVRDELIHAARADVQIAGAALVGSAATGREDAWSDIDLVLQVAGEAEADEVASRWTRHLYDQHGAVHHVDVVADGVLYRVFLLDSSLQVDVSFWPEERFGPTESGFRLLFGSPQPATEPGALDASKQVGLAWLYALHARSAIARNRVWQAVMMLDHLRDQILVLACIRNDLNPHHGRQADRLPDALLRPLAQARATSTTPGELARSHAALLELLMAEVMLHSDELAQRLASPLRTLANVRS